jgi:hypothetical protein
MQPLFKILMAVFITLAINSPAISGESTSAMHTGHEMPLSPHIHGSAELNIVLFNDQLSLELHTPAVNLLGFEHNKHNPEQQAIVKSTRDHLTNAKALFFFEGGECKLIQPSPHFSALLKSNESTHPTLEKDDNQHSDIEAHFSYTCAQPVSLKSITTKLLEVFPGITSLQVQWIIHNQQGAATLNHQRNTLNF